MRNCKIMSFLVPLNNLYLMWCAFLFSLSVCSVNFKVKLKVQHTWSIDYYCIKNRPFFKILLYLLHKAELEKKKVKKRKYLMLTH